MITITTERGIIEIPCPEASDAQAIQGNCGHGVSLFQPCFRCILEDNLQQFEAIRKRKPICYAPNCVDPACRLDHPCDCPDLDTEYSHFESDHGGGE